MIDGGSGAPRRRLPIAGYALVFPAAIVVHVWVGTSVHPASMVRPLIISIVLALALTALFTVLARSRDLGGLAATAVALWLIAAVSLPATGLVLAPAVILLIALGLARRGQPWPLGELITRGMTLVAAITAIAVGLQVVQSGSFGEAVSDVQLDLAGLGPSAAAQTGAPDIYLVLLDGFPGMDAAALDPGRDSSAFPGGLKDRGFDVAERTHSNYLQTPQTVASVLAMHHLADDPLLDPPWGPSSRDAFRLRRAINKADGLTVLHDHGYGLTAIASGFAEPELRHVDRFIEPVGLNEFELGLLRGTGAGNVLTFLAPDFPAALQRGRIRSSFETLTAEAARASDRPKFVFAHIAGPHPPWVFDAAGNDVHDELEDYYLDFAPDRGIERSEAIRRHLDQAAYIGTLSLAAVDRILADAGDSKPVIIIFSDHGSGTGFDQTHPLDSDLVERSSNILAAYSPGHPGLFATATTPVNILPRVLDTYLGTDIPEQPDTTFAWRTSRLDTVAVDPANPHAAGVP